MSDSNIIKSRGASGTNFIMFATQSQSLEFYKSDAFTVLMFFFSRNSQFSQYKKMWIYNMQNLSCSLNRW